MDIGRQTLQDAIRTFWREQHGDAEMSEGFLARMTDLCTELLGTVEGYEDSQDLHEIVRIAMHNIVSATETEELGLGDMQMSTTPSA